MYADDVLADVELRSCSSGARGLWWYMLMAMHKSPKYGYLLQANGEQFTDEQIARAFSVPEADCAVYLIELKSAGVFSQNRNGIIFSRRMLRDESVRKQWRKDQKNKRDRDKNIRSDVRSMSDSLSSSFSSSTSIHKKKDKPTTARAPLPEWLPLETWSAFLKMRKRIRRPATEDAEVLLIRKLESLRESGNPPKEVLEQSIRNSWQDVFALKGAQENGKGPTNSSRRKDHDKRADEAILGFLEDNRGVVQGVDPPVAKPGNRER
jgi:hypothetical protein